MTLVLDDDPTAARRAGGRGRRYGRALVAGGDTLRARAAGLVDVLAADDVIAQP